MEQFLSLRRRRVRVLTHGHGAPVLFVHGFPLGADLWRPQLDAAPAGWRFIAPDLRGFGGSERVPPGETDGATTLDAHVTDLLSLLDIWGEARAVVVGLSMGGYIAQALVKHAPVRTRALVLCDTRSEADSPEALANRRAMREEVAANGAPAAADAMIQRLLGPSSQRERPELVGVLRELIERNPPAGIDDAIVALMTRPDLTPALADIGCPTLLVAGEEDALTPVELHRRMHEAIAGSRLEIITGAGHVSSLEQPEAFNQVLHAFLKTLQ